MSNLRGAYLGPPGTFSHEAALKFWQSGFELVPCSTAREVIGAYREEEVEQAILAIDTSLAGTVGENLDEIAKLKAVRVTIYFLDMEGHIQNPPLSHLFRHFPEGRWLGSYPREY